MSHPTYDFAGKHVLITGGSRGIGATIVRHFTKAGATVLFNYGRSADEANALAAETGAHAVQADLATQAGVEAVAAAVGEKFGGKLDVLVNNAGVFLPTPLGQADPDVVRRQNAINVEAVIGLTHALAPHIPDGGRIINFGSVLGDAVPFPGISEYSATKAYVQTVSRGWARDLGSRNITVNTVQPGPIDTEMNPDSSENPAASGQIAKTALARYGKPDEIAPAVLFLASDAASYITGAVLNIDGGFNA
ncbi:MAG: SDR family oxidoreductase [Planctomycetota bacterium]